MRPADVLIVEDDPLLVAVIRRNLSVRGIDVQSAAGVVQAVTALEEGCPSLVLLDVDLPDGSGWEVLRALRRQGCQDTRSIVITGLRPNGHLVRELECAAVLEKPFPIETLVRLVVASLTHTGGEMARPVAPGP